MIFTGNHATPPGGSPRYQQAQKPWRLFLKLFPGAVLMGRGARDACRRAPRDGPEPLWSVGTNLSEERVSAGSGRGGTLMQFKIYRKKKFLA